MIYKLSKSILLLFFILLLSNYSYGETKIDEAVDKTTDFLKSVSKRGLNKNQTAEFLNNYAITLKDERTDGEVTYIFDSESYKRYKDGNIIYDNYTNKNEIVDTAKTININGIVPVLVESLKEAITRIETLETKVAALEGS